MSSQMHCTLDKHTLRHMRCNYNRALGRLSTVFNALALLCAVAVPCWKVYETSHAFREAADPSIYDDVKAWFEADGDTKWLTDKVGGPKVAMRVYTFIFPFWGTFLFALCALLARSCQGKAGPKTTSSTLEGARYRARGIVARWARVLRATLSVQVHFPWRLPWCPQALTRGEILSALLFLSLNLAVIWARMHRSLGRGANKLEFLATSSKTQLMWNTFQGVEVWAHTFGVLAVMNVGWYLMVPIARRSIILEVLGISWEYAIKWHRWLGAYTVVIILLHSILYFVVWFHGNSHPDYDPTGVMLKENLASCNIEDGCDEDQALRLRQNWYGIVSSAAALIIATTSMNFIRRRYFEIFYYAHHLFLVLLVFLCLHSASAIIYLMPGLAIYVIDKACRVMACKLGGVTASVQVVTKDLVEVRVSLAEDQRSSYKAGQYVFLNVPSISYLQWHPFSLSSAPREAGGEQIVFHVKALGGPSSWTSLLLEAAQKAEGGKLNVKVDGFYGHDAASSLDGPRTAVMLVGGGVGVTPLLSILAELSERPLTRVALLWCTRSGKEFLALAPRIAAAKARLGERLFAQVAITRVDNRTAPDNHEEMIKKMIPGLADEAKTTPVERYGIPANGEAAAKARLGERLFAQMAITRVDDRTAPDNHEEMIKQMIAGLADEAKTTPIERYGIPANGESEKQPPPGDQGEFVRIMPSQLWFALICFVSLIVMTLLFAEAESLKEQEALDAHSTRALAFFLPCIVIALVCVLFAIATTHRRTRAFFTQPAAASGKASVDDLDLATLTPELLGDRVGKRLDLRSAFEHVAATFGHQVDEVKVVVCGATSQVAGARAECERLNKKVGAGGCLWRFEEESWDW